MYEVGMCSEEDTWPFYESPDQIAYGVKLRADQGRSLTVVTLREVGALTRSMATEFRLPPRSRLSSSERLFFVRRRPCSRGVVQLQPLL